MSVTDKCDNVEDDTADDLDFQETEYFHESMTPGYLCNDFFMSFSVRQEVLSQIRTLDIDSNDVFLAGYPRSGITWTQRIIGVLRDGADVANSQDYDLTKQFPFIEYYDIFHDPPYDGFELFQGMQPPRTVKTHLPSSMVPKAFQTRGKIVVILRNPKDVLVSYHNLLKNLTIVEYTATLEDIFQLFKDEHMPYGCWFKWVMSWWEAKQNLFLNTKLEISKLADFLGYTIEDSNMENVLEAVGFSSMQKTVSFPGMKNFIRRGGIGGWRESLTEEMSSWIDEKVESELYQKGFPIKFQFDSFDPPNV